MSDKTTASDVEATVSSGGFTSAGRRAQSLLFAVFAAIYDGILSLITRVARFAVVVGTTFHSAVLVPVTVYAVGLIAKLWDFLSRARYSLRCFWHKATVAAEHFRANRFALATAILAVTLVCVASTFYSVGIKITVDGEEVGYMYSRAEYEEAVSFVEKRASEILERPYSVASNVSFELGIVPREKIISKESLRSLFFSKIEDVSMLYALTVDGQVVGASRNRETLQAMLDELLYTNDPNVKAQFAQDVSISQRYVDAEYLLSYDEIRKKLTSTVHEAKTYKIQSGDTIDAIAGKNGITRAQLLSLNPSLAQGKFRAGAEVTVSKAVPFLSVEAVRHVEYIETIPFETKKVKTDSLYAGSTKVSVNGRVGTRKVVADVTYVDNKEVSRNIVSSTITQQPVTKVISVGTKARPKTVATGKFRRPINGGIISSDFGYRRSGFHKGVDFAAKIGTPVYAADGGTVTYAGWRRGGWGYLVVINHGNGLESYYAHNSKVLVSVGQKVAKGEQISKMGSTGNSSGPHVHLEVHKNGRVISPWTLLR